MIGFDTKALVLFPNVEVYTEANTRMRWQWQQATSNLVKYLKHIGMEPHVFLTDDMALELPNLDVHYVNTLTRGDLFFAVNNCGIPKTAMSWDLVEFPELTAEIAEKNAIEPNASVEERFEIVQLRDKKAITSIIPQYNVVINFHKKGSSRYRVVIKPNGGKIRILVDTSTFIAKTYINNVEENPIDLLGVGFGNKSLVNWEV